jgi:hypothetical protein
MRAATPFASKAFDYSLLGAPSVQSAFAAPGIRKSGTPRSLSSEDSGAHPSIQAWSSWLTATTRERREKDEAHRSSRFAWIRHVTPSPSTWLGRARRSIGRVHTHSGGRMRARPWIVSLLLATCASAAEANLISNPGFETFSGTYAGDGCRQLVPSSTTLSSWTPVGNEIAVCTTPNQYLITASEGVNFLDIAGYQNTLSKGVSQTLSGLVAGQQYSFTTDLGISNIASCVPGANCGGPISVLVTIGSVSQTLTHDSAAPGVQWGTYGFTFTATTANPMLTVTGASLPAGGAFIGLDNLTLVAVPEPAVALLAGIALAAVGVRSRRA